MIGTYFAITERRSKMPPEVSPCPPATPTIQFLTHHHQPPRYKHYRLGAKKMMITKMKLIPILVFILSGISILRLLKISTITSISSPPSTAALPPTPPHSRNPSESRPDSSASSPALTKKEYHFLSKLISQKAPCNLLVFGFEQQYLNLSKINSGGNTVFLEDNPEKLSTIKTNHNNTRIYKVEYLTLAGDAYKLLQHGRKNPACGLNLRSLKNSTCPLALKIPKEVYKRKWDVVMVDGPRGDTPDAPGRMAAIYTAGVIARAGNMTDVIVHDVDRMIEKWFSWEFLCDENLVSSKGKLWNFRIACKSNSTTFCPAKTILIQ